MAKLSMFSEVYEDLALLSVPVRAEVDRYLKDLTRAPYLGKKLERLLVNCRSIYVAEATHRIVYRVNDGNIKVVLIIAVAEREQNKVYSLAEDRLRKHGVI